MKNKKLCCYIKKIIALIIIMTIYFQINIKQKTIRIMPIGDSITNGMAIIGSYRKYLYNLLTKDGYSIKMVGPILSNKILNFKDENENITYEASHCGYPGYTVKSDGVQNGIMNTVQDNDYLNKYNPDIIILMIGTNDVKTNLEVENIINNLKDFLLYIKNNTKTNSIIFVSSIPPLDSNSKIGYGMFNRIRKDKDDKKRTDMEVKTLVDKKVNDYNICIKELVNKLRKDWKNIYFSDLFSIIPNADTFLYDGVHPNEKAHKLIGGYLYRQLNSILLTI